MKSSSHDSLDCLFRPKSIAVIGVSGQPIETGNFSRLVLTNLRNAKYEGNVFPVNPRHDTIEGFNCFHKIDELPKNVDLAVLLVPAGQIANSLEECSSLGIQCALIGASGFSEIGDVGRQRQSEVLKIAREHKIRIVGPNSLGVMYAPNRMAAAFTPAIHPSLFDSDGSVAYVGQSGALGGSIMAIAREAGMPLVAWLSTGNQADVSAYEGALYLLSQVEVKSIIIYVESPGNAQDLIKLADLAKEQSKTVVLLRSGRSGAGQRAVASHTGAMIGPDISFDVLALDLGIILATDVDEAIRSAHALSYYRPSGRRIGIVSGSGGAGSILADRCEEEGLVVAQFSEQLQMELHEWIPDFGAFGNPVDVTGQATKGSGERFAEICKAIGKSGEVDQLIAVMGTLTGDAAERFANTLELTASESGIPLQFVWLANREETQGGRGLFRSRGFPVLDSLTNSAITARLLFEVGESRRRHRLEDPVPAVPTADVLASLLPHHVSLEYEAADFFDVLEILHPKGILVANADEARLACRVLDGPFVLKLQARDVLHKTERGAVRIDVSENDVPNRVLELLEMPNIESEGVLIQEMVTSAGVELIVGVQKSLANFPAMITVGLGGIFAELYRDVATHVAPVGVPTALDMLNSLRASRLLNGYRGNSQFDSLAAANVIARISAVGAALGELLEEIEINPLIVLSEGEGAIALDFHARIRSSGRTESE